MMENKVTVSYKKLSYAQRETLDLNHGGNAIYGSVNDPLVKAILAIDPEARIEMKRQ